MAYNYLTEIDYSASGDTFYTGMVTSEANFLSIDNEIYNARAGEASLSARIQEVAALSTSGSGILISSLDTDLGYLDGKLLAGEGIDFTVGSPAGDETLTIDCEDATTSNKGVLETATNTEALAFAAGNKALVPSNLAALNATDSQKGVCKFSTANFLVSSGNVTVLTATSAQKGAAKFSTDNFAVSSGDVTIKTAGVAIAEGGTGQSAKTAAFDALAPTTTKGDVIVSNGSDNLRIAIGANDTVLTADSGEASGVKWVANFPSTTNMLFGQTAAPTGWTKKTNWTNNSMIVYTTGNIAQGGSVDAKATHQHGAFTLAANEIPAHTHGVDYATLGTGSARAAATDEASGGTLTSSSIGSGASHQHTANSAPYFLSVISAVKD